MGPTWWEPCEPAEPRPLIGDDPRASQVRAGDVPVMLAGVNDEVRLRLGSDAPPALSAGFRLCGHGWVSKAVLVDGLVSMLVAGGTQIFHEDELVEVVIPR